MIASPRLRRVLECGPPRRAASFPDWWDQLPGWDDAPRRDGREHARDALKRSRKVGPHSKAPTPRPGA
jgi:hypothetical protein